MSPGKTATESTWCHPPSAERTLTGVASIRLLTRRAISIACLSRELGLPGPNGFNGIVKSVVGFVSPPVLNGHSHSIEPEFSCFSILGYRVWGTA